MTHQTKKLAAVLNSLRDLELAQLAIVTRTQAAKADQIRTLRTAAKRAMQRAFEPDELTPAILSASDVAWRQWVATQITAENIDLARLAAICEKQKIRTRLAFGRSAAFEASCAKNIRRKRRIQ